MVLPHRHYFILTVTLLVWEIGTGTNSSQWVSRISRALNSGLNSRSWMLPMMPCWLSGALWVFIYRWEAWVVAPEWREIPFLRERGISTPKQVLTYFFKLKYSLALNILLHNDCTIARADFLFIYFFKKMAVWYAKAQDNFSPSAYWENLKSSSR